MFELSVGEEVQCVLNARVTCNCGQWPVVVGLVHSVEKKRTTGLFYI